MKQALLLGLCLVASQLNSLQAQQPSQDLQQKSGAVQAGQGPRFSSQTPVQSYMDTSVDPCVDFYAYACGDWMKTTPIPPDRERVMRVGELMDRNRSLLLQELQRAARAPATPLQKQYGSFFQACTDLSSLDSAGLRPLEPTLKAIADLSSTAQIADLLGSERSLAHGIVTLTVERNQERPDRWMPVLKPADLTLPSAQEYTESSQTAVRHRKELHHYLTVSFTMLGDSEELAKQEAENVLRIETALASGELSRADARDPSLTFHLMSLQALQKLNPEFKWERYFALQHVPSSPINVTQLEYLRALERALHSYSLDAWKSYFRIQSLTSVAPHLSAPFRQAQFRFFQTELRGVDVMESRAQTCTTLTDKEMGDAVGQEWLKENFPNDRKQAALAILENLRLALSEELAGQTWLSPSAKETAQKKLAAMQFYVAAPEHWRDYSSLRLDPAQFIADLHQVELFNQQQEYRRIATGSKEHRWYWTVPTVDANYDTNENNIEIPAGLLQPPYLGKPDDLAANYGAFGMLAGHEFTHGFDDAGSLYDEKGRLQGWFTPEDKAGFERMTSCEVSEYSRFEALPGLRLDGKLGLGEETADNGGLRIAHDAFLDAEKKQGVLPASELRAQDQRFFVSYAQTWCEKRRPEYQRVRGQTDPHPPGEFRVNGAVQNLDAFGKAFNCHVGQPMTPADACHVW